MTTTTSSTTASEIAQSILEPADCFSFAGWQQFVEHLSQRSGESNGSPAGIDDELDDLFGQQDQPLLWGLPVISQTDAGQHLIRAAKLHDASTAVVSAEKDLLSWLNSLGENSNSDIHTLAIGIGVVAVLPKLAESCEEANWLAAAEQVAAMANADHQSVLSTLLANELRLMIGLQFPELKCFDQYASQAHRQLESQLEELLDADGAILSKHVQDIPAILGSWTRTLLLLDHASMELDDEPQERWEWFVRYSMRLLRSDGTHMLGSNDVPFHLHLYKTATKVSNDKNDRLIARGLLPGGNPKNKKVKMLHEEGTFSEWAGLAVFQQDWNADSPRVAVALDEEKFRMEVCRGSKLFELTGLPDVSINGKTLQTDDEWEEVGSHFDDDIDYLELELDLDDDVTLQRQLCLIHDDEMLLIADSVFCKSAERIDYRNEWTLADSITPMQESENNEYYLRQKEIRSLVLPLNLSEWQSANSDDKIQATDQKLTVSQSVLGKTLYSPVWVSLNPEASVQPRTWRKLSVSEAMQTVPDDVARAYRVRIGDNQWVFYKSFGEVGNRTFLGQNQTSDLFIGKFLEDGNVEELLAIDP